VQSETPPASDRTAFVIAGVLGATGVALGAFGAHGLKGWLQTVDNGAQRLAWWQTATEYHLWHALLAGILASQIHRFPRLRTGVLLCVVGTLLFSGSLYLMTLTDLRVLGAVTPFGGVAFIVAWLWLVIGTRRA